MKQMTCSLVVVLGCAGLWVWGGTQVSQAEEAKPRVEAPATQPVETANDYLVRQMKSGWVSPERRKWRIEYRAIEGMPDTWHVAGTDWWVRVHPNIHWPEAGKMDRDAVYEIGGVALDQNFGMIDFYIYSHPRKVEP